MNSTIRNVVLNNKKKYILDEVKGSVLALSLRKLKPLAQRAIRVRRSSDNAEMDIGFVNGGLDITTLLSFVGGNSGFISIWYDQSGYGNHAIQTNTGNQPGIVSSGVVGIDDNGIANIVISSSLDTHFVVANNSSIQLSTMATINVVHTPSSAGENGAGRITDKGGTFLTQMTSGGAVILNQTSDSNFYDIGIQGINTIAFNSVINNTFFYKNRALHSTKVATTLGLNSSPLMLFNRSDLVRNYEGKCSELIIFKNMISNIERQKLERDQLLYYNI